MSALKIAFVFDDSLDQPDGVQQYVLTMGSWLSAQGHEVHYLTGQTKRTDIPNMHSLSRNIGVRFNGNRLAIPLPTSRRKLRALLMREQYDVLHLQAPFSPWLGGRIIDEAPARTVCVATFHILPHSRLVTAASYLLAAWSRRTWRRLDQVWSVSPAAADFARKVFNQDSTVLPNVIDYDRFHISPPQPQSAGPVQLLYLGRLVPRKGCDKLLRALTLLNPDDLPDYHLTICGKGPLQAKLSAYVQDHGLDCKVTFAGFVSEADKPGYYANADIAIFPSTGGESFGIVLLEAMANGRTAVLAADNPGYASVIQRPDMLFAAQDPADLARVLEAYLRQPAKRQDAAAWGEQYTKEFDTARVGARLVEAYDRLSTQKNVP